MLLIHLFFNGLNKMFVILAITSVWKSFEAVFPFMVSQSFHWWVRACEQGQGSVEIHILGPFSSVWKSGVLTPVDYLC